MAMGMNKFGMTARLAAGFGLVIVLLIAVAGTSLVRLRGFSQTVEGFAASRVPKVIAAASSVEALLQASRQMRDVLLSDAEKEIKEALAGVRKSAEQGQALVDKLQTMATTPKEKELLQAIVAA